MLTLAEKQQTAVGLARIDRDRCLPWAYYTPCIVCEEMCPIPDKAIGLEEAEVVNGQGDVITVQRPSVIKEMCIGCGLCVPTCPTKSIDLVHKKDTAAPPVNSAAMYLKMYRDRRGLIGAAAVAVKYVLGKKI